MDDDPIDAPTVMCTATSSFDPPTMTAILFDNPYPNEASEGTQFANIDSVYVEDPDLLTRFFNESELMTQKLNDNNNVNSVVDACINLTG